MWEWDGENKKIVVSKWGSGSIKCLLLNRVGDFVLNKKCSCFASLSEGEIQIQLLHALRGNLSQARHVHVIGRTHTKANDFIVDALAQILFDAATQCVLQVPENTGGGIANRQSGTGADYWYQKNTRAAAVILDSKCNGLAQRRSDADIRKQAQHHPAYTEADILFVAAEQAEKILVYHSIFPHGLFAPVQGRKFQISVI